MFAFFKELTACPYIRDRACRDRFLDKHGNAGERTRKQNFDIPSRLNGAMESRWCTNDRSVRRIERVRLDISFVDEQEDSPLHDPGNLPR